LGQATQVVDCPWTKKPALQVGLLVLEVGEFPPAAVVVVVVEVVVVVPVKLQLPVASRPNPITQALQMVKLDELSKRHYWQLVGQGVQVSFTALSQVPLGQFGSVAATFALQD
jgi:hypothetical protein